ncbi:peroxiredoxin [Pseudohalocynthiibacter aestuariivivens]|jgi:thioredoxin-dependent peroxiredoxin|uniref:thioredoxin-dependent peroxiredoxin n=1 Tax=Pseudohalocynthiibacter aestuariivivens TaxID=1591409 RepID=A0ABV5JDH4_9RHOB|nr:MULTISPECIES: peroxiredoxin [Pseudohalocynthiibacter]MBS9718628.1 peroxiredoxin [Pseudohalocynthiibacter aestuariivivens]MCK0103639.1 peroxiredoxin [Pseudohalocynthiibacter sp. F2068]
MVDIGEIAPDFTLPRDGGGILTLSSLRPDNVVLFFYPKDDTPGCTKESIAFTQHLDAFKAAGTQVIGISKDTVAKHDKFRDKHSLGVPLLSDAEGTVCEDYGVWVEKKMYGKTFLGIERTTVLINESGEILHVWRKVKVPGHVEDVLNMAESL